MIRLRYAVYLILAISAGAIGFGSRFTPPHASARYVMGRGPTIVLLHGLGSRIEHWFPVARELAKRFRVVFVELPGHGVSDVPGFSFERARMSLDAALAKEKSPVILVGHSLGGLLATDEALLQPGKVRGLVLVEAALRPQVQGEEADAMRKAIDDDIDGLLEQAYRSFGRDSVQGEMLYRQARQVDPAIMGAWIRLSLDTDLSERAAELKMPVLAILSDRSWEPGEPWADVSQALGYEHVPHLRSTRITNSGHFLMLDHPEHLAGIIESFARWPEGEPVALVADPDVGRSAPAMPVR